MIRDTSSQDAVLIVPTWKRQKARLWISIGVIVLGIVAALLFSAWRNSAHSVSMARLRMATVSHGSLVRDASVNGKIIAAVSPTVFSSASGTITLTVKAGDTVNQGQVVAELEAPDVSEALKREQSHYEQLEAEIARQKILASKQKLLAQRDADQAEIERMAAENAYRRIEKAGGLGIVPENDFAKVQNTLKSAEIRSKHAAAAAQLESADVQLELKSKTKQLERQRIALNYAKRRVDALHLRAPISGLIGAVSVPNRSMVAADSPVLSLVDLSQLEVEVAIPEIYLADLGLGMRAEIHIGDRKVTGQLASMSPEVANNQVLARIRFDAQQPSGLRQSQRVSVRLLIEEKNNVVVVQRGPFLEQFGGKFAYVFNQGIAEKRAIQVGAVSVSQVQIIDGVTAGEQVVIAGSDAFDNAKRISIHN